jgi:hypothetical protein
MRGLLPYDRGEAVAMVLTLGLTALFLWLLIRG